MREKFSKSLSKAILLATISVLPVVAQNARVEVSKHSSEVPKACESVVPASIPTSGTGQIDIPALVKEAICKGAGDMLSEYTYVTSSSKREKDKKNRIKEETFTYEVFFPTLKSGTHTRGVLVVTSHNGVPVPPNELEKERSRAAERIEKEEAKIARETPTLEPPGNSSTVSEGDKAQGTANKPVSEVNSNNTTGMHPLGTYAQTGINREAFGMKRGSVVLAVRTFLKTCDLTLTRREAIDGRETLVFNFTPRAEAQFSDNQKYIAQLSGEVWIDVQDRIVTRLIGWPANALSSAPSNAPSTAQGSKDTSKAVEPSLAIRPPAVYVEMVRLPQQGIWLPHVVRINGADYPALFDGITTDSTSTYSNYIRFSTEVKDVNVTPPQNQQ